MGQYFLIFEGQAGEMDPCQMAHDRIGVGPGGAAAVVGHIAEGIGGPVHHVSVPGGNGGFVVVRFQLPWAENVVKISRLQGAEGTVGQNQMTADVGIPVLEFIGLPRTQPVEPAHAAAEKVRDAQPDERFNGVADLRRGKGGTLPVSDENSCFLMYHNKFPPCSDISLF